MSKKKSRNGYCIYVNSLCGGPTPVVSDGEGKYVVFDTELEAQKEIADSMILRLQAFVDGDYDFDDVSSTEEYVVPVTVEPDGTIVDEDGGVFGPRAESAAGKKRKREKA